MYYSLSIFYHLIVFFFQPEKMKIPVKMGKTHLRISLKIQRQDLYYYYCIEKSEYI